jgi:phosphoglucosamine mutase
MVQKLFGTSGVRRLADELTDEFVSKLAFSLASYTDDPAIAVGRDTRPSSKRLSVSFSSALTRVGKDVVDLGVATTPTVGMATEDYGTGIVVTASHNPPEWNGFKFLADGRAYSPAQERSIEKIFYSGNFAGLSRKPGSVRKEDYAEKHIKRIIDKLGKVKKPVKILLDCANGAGTLVTPILLRRMGFDVIAINTGMDGRFAHGLEPTAKNLEETCKLVKENDADVGVVHDGDADRSAAIGADGRLIDWDDFLAVLAYGKKKVVTTVDASMRIDDVCSEVIRTPIGDVAVADAICKFGADFGGEPSGSMIFPEVHLFPDGPLAAAVIAKMVSERRFYETLEKIKKYPVERLKIFYMRGMDPSEIMTKVKAGVLKEFAKDAGEVSEVDGVRISLSGGWFLVRPSGTEPCIRITAEAKTKKKLSEIVERSKRCVEKVL